MLKIDATKGCEGCENDTSSHNHECIARLKKPLVAKMQMDHSLNPMFQCPLKFLSLSQSMHIRDGSSGGGFAEES